MSASAVFVTVTVKEYVQLAPVEVVNVGPELKMTFVVPDQKYKSSIPGTVPTRRGKVTVTATLVNGPVFEGTSSRQGTNCNSPQPLNPPVLHTLLVGLFCP